MVPERSLLLRVAVSLWRGPYALEHECNGTGIDIDRCLGLIELVNCFRGSTQQPHMMHMIHWRKEKKGHCGACPVPLSTSATDGDKE